MKLNHIRFWFLVLILFITQVGVTLAGDLSYSPTKLEVKMVPGQYQTYTVWVTSPNDAPSNYPITCKLKFTAGDGNTLEPWTTAPNITFTAPNQTIEWVIGFTVPLSATQAKYVANLKATAISGHVGESADVNLVFYVQYTPIVNVSGGPFTYDGLGHSATATATGSGGVTVSGSFVLTYDGSSTLPITIGTYAVVANFTSSDPYYTDAVGYGSITINPRPITVTADAKTKAYGDSDPTLTYQVTSGSLVSGDSFSGSITRVSGESIGSYAIQQGTLSLNSNYVLTYVGANLVITARPITVTADAKSKEYGASDPPLTYQITSGSLLAGDSFSGALTRAAGENVGTYAIQQGTLSLGSNYNLTYVGANLTITARSITVTADAQTKEYGASDPALTYQITTGSLVSGDSFTGALTRVVGESIGAYAIQRGTLSLSSNYVLIYVGANLTITVRAITVTADAKSKIYGEADPALTYQITSGSLASGDSFTGGLTRDAGENVGTYAITKGSLALNSNYVLTFFGANLSIDPKIITVTADTKTKIYGESDPALTYTNNGGLGASDFTGTLTRSVGESVGEYNILQGSLALVNTNYTISYFGAKLTITVRDVTVTADAKTKVYGEADPAFTYNITSGSLVGSDSFSGALTRAAGEDVGTPEIQQGSLTLGGNYNLIYVGAILTITKRSVTVTANAQTKIYGDIDPALTYQITSGSLASWDSFSGALTRDTGENVGSYAITQGTLALNSNYVLTYVGANLVITKRPITVTADAQTKIYGDSDPTLTYKTTSGSLVGSDAFSGSLARDGGEDIGTYAILQGTLALSSNYALTYVGANLTITNRAITVTADAKSKIYGESDPLLTYQITAGALASGDSFTGGLSRVSGENVGTYAIEQGTLSLNGNYNLTYNGALLTINSKIITVTADAKTKVYGESDPALTYTNNGGLGASDFTGELAREPGDTVDVYNILKGTLALKDTNYTMKYVDATFTITKRLVTVTADAKTKVYGEIDPVLSYQITSGTLKSGDSFTGTITRDAGENVGTYAITQGTLSLNNNYTLTYVGANLTITKKPIVVTADNKFKNLGDPDPTLSYQITDGGLISPDALAGGLTRTPGEAVGTYPITIGELHLECNPANYEFTFVPGTLTIRGVLYYSLSQGFYGNAGGKDPYTGMTTPALLISLLSQSLPFVVGGVHNSISINTATTTDVNNLLLRMPAGGTPVKFPAMGAVTMYTLPSSVLNKKTGKFGNVLIGQTITLNLNIRHYSALGALVIENTYMFTSSSSDGTPKAYYIPANVLTALGTSNTVADLLALANKALDGGSTAPASISDINSAVTAFNEGFDNGKYLVGFSSSPTLALMNGITYTAQVEVELPTDFAIYQNYPNPFNPSTTVQFDLPENSNVIAVIYDLLGREVITLVNGELSAGRYQKVWDSRNKFGSLCSSGIYILRIEIRSVESETNFISTKKMMLLK